MSDESCILRRVGIGVLNKKNNKRFNMISLSVPVCWNTFHMDKMEHLLELGTAFHAPKSSPCYQNWPILAHDKVYLIGSELGFILVI